MDPSHSNPVPSSVPVRPVPYIQKDNKLLCFSLQAPSVARSSQSRRFSDGVCILPSPLSHVPTKHSSRQDPFNDNKGLTLIREHIRIESEGALRPPQERTPSDIGTNFGPHSLIHSSSHPPLRKTVTPSYVRRQFYFMYYTHVQKRPKTGRPLQYLPRVYPGFSQQPPSAAKHMPILISHLYVLHYPAARQFE